MKVLIFIPCSKAKVGRVGCDEPGWITPARLPQSWPKLTAGRAEMGVDRGGARYRAVPTYCGNLFTSAPSLPTTTASVTIVSAGYGLVGRDDPICNYDCEMKGNVARQWRRAGLQDAVTELICRE